MNKKVSVIVDDQEIVLDVDFIMNSEGYIEIDDYQLLEVPDIDNYLRWSSTVGLDTLELEHYRECIDTMFYFLEVGIPESIDIDEELIEYLVDRDREDYIDRVDYYYDLYKDEIRSRY